MVRDRTLNGLWAVLCCAMLVSTGCEKPVESIPIDEDDDIEVYDPEAAQQQREFEQWLAQCQRLEAQIKESRAGLRIAKDALDQGLIDSSDYNAMVASLNGLVETFNQTCANRSGPP